MLLPCSKLSNLLLQQLELIVKSPKARKTLPCLRASLKEKGSFMVVAVAGSPSEIG